MSQESAVVEKSENLESLEEEFSKLQKEANKKRDKYLAEAKEEVIKLSTKISEIDSENKESAPLHFELGTILNKVEKEVVSKSLYTQWLKDNKKEFRFASERYFQYAKQIARMGDFAKDNLHLGKNRLILFDRLCNSKLAEQEKGKALGERLKGEEKEKAKKEILNTILSNDKYSQFIQGTNGNKVIPTKEHADAIITINLFVDNGIEFITHNQALNIVKNVTFGPIKVSTVNRVKKWLDDKNTQKEKVESLDKFANDGKDALPRPKKTKIDKKNVKDLVENLAKVSGKIDFNSVGQTKKEDIEKVLELMPQLKQKLEEALVSAQEKE